ncbi:MAG: ABC transporter ATP-binding protein [Alphaproteobacteria bacterium]
MADIMLQRVTKTFDSRNGTVTALANIDLEVDRHEFVAIVGASGCGKSTLLNLVAGFDAASGGAVLVDGKRVTRPGPDRGVVFQQSALFPWLTVRQNIGFGLELAANKARQVRGPSVEAILERVGLTRFGDHFPAQLSGGMRQRAAIAGVLVIDPAVLLMDEPFGALDALTRSLMHDFLMELWEENRKTVMLVTHDITEAVYLSDRLVVMAGHPGRIREIVPIDLPRPRRYDVQATPEFIRLRDHVTRIVREEAALVSAIDATEAG